MSAFVTSVLLLTPGCPSLALVFITENIKVRNVNIPAGVWTSVPGSPEERVKEKWIWIVVRRVSRVPKPPLP